MKRVLKWIGIILAGLIGVMLLVALGGYAASERRLNRVYDVAVAPIAAPADAANIEEGRRLTIIRGCVDCHTPDFGGQALLEDPVIGSIYSANLTAGQGSATAGWSAEDWARAIRNGVSPEGRGLLMMPSGEYAGLSDEDVGRIVAYLRTTPPVDRALPASSAGPMARALLVTNQLPLLLTAEQIDHDSAPPHSVVPEASVEYGAYQAMTCTGCHGKDLGGGPVPFSPPDRPQAANLTPSGDLGGWTLDGFKTTLRTGVTPEGRQLDPLDMPWPLTSQMTDVELEALWLYFQSLPPAAVE
jgi:mono/diheme cytochrome c family protein